MEETIDLSRRFNKNNMHKFVEFIRELNRTVGFKMSARGWCYALEQKGLVTKGQFDKVENLINRCRKEGYLPVDLTAEESSRGFLEIHRPETDTPKEFVSYFVESLKDCEDYYEPDWWKYEEYYIQMVVEKIDLVTLFRPVCKEFHIPIANAKGWSSILQRAEYARRFKKAEEYGLKCVLLYCGDHDPDGLRISETLRKNIEDVSKVTWQGGGTGYDPANLEIHRFGLNYDFIKKHGLTWIDNLETGSGGTLAVVGDGGEPQRGYTRQGKPHPNWELPYLKKYLKDIGVRKCEANSLVIAPEAGRQLCKDTIISYLGTEAEERFRTVKQEAVDMIENYKSDLGIGGLTEDMLDILDSADES